MSRIPPSLSGGLPCASAADAATASTPPRKPERTRLIKSLLSTRRIALRPLFPLSRSCRSVRRRQATTSWVFSLNGTIPCVSMARCADWQKLPNFDSGAGRGPGSAQSCCLRRRGSTYSADCSFELQGEGRVAAVVDPRSFRLQDGREVVSPASSRSRRRSLCRENPWQTARPPWPRS